jgi:vacuolar-type H+-ATPase subunit F/Vma7
VKLLKKITGGKKMEISITKEELYELIKKAVREVLREESLEIVLKSIPVVSDEEMQDIEKLYGKPSSDKKIAYTEIIEI